MRVAGGEGGAHEAPRVTLTGGSSRRTTARASWSRASKSMVYSTRRPILRAWTTSTALSTFMWCDSSGAGIASSFTRSHAHLGPARKASTISQRTGSASARKPSTDVELTTSSCARPVAPVRAEGPAVVPTAGLVGHPSTPGANHDVIRRAWQLDPFEASPHRESLSVVRSTIRPDWACVTDGMLDSGAGQRTRRCSPDGLGNLAKVRVAGSNPVVRSERKPRSSHLRAAFRGALGLSGRAPSHTGPTRHSATCRHKSSTGRPSTTMGRCGERGDHSFRRCQWRRRSRRARPPSSSPLRHSGMGMGVLPDRGQPALSIAPLTP